MSPGDSIGVSDELSIRSVELTSLSLGNVIYYYLCENVFNIEKQSKISSSRLLLEIEENKKSSHSSLNRESVNKWL